MIKNFLFLEVLIEFQDELAINNLYVRLKIFFITIFF